MKLVDDLFEMNGGYVLNFSDRTMGIFFLEELNVDIDDPVYHENGTSKAKRLRCFLNKVDLATAITTLKALRAYREAVRQSEGRDEWVTNAKGQFLSLINRLEGKPEGTASPNPPPRPALDIRRILALKTKLIELSSLPPHPRGYAFEAWLKEAFDCFGLEAREPFRHRGEQIDGSFVLQGETYLVEAKWQSAPTGAADLHAFHGKLEQKAAWARGLFVSNSGFTPEGLAAFGRAKRVICMDGLDLFDALEKQIPLNHVLERKVRRAAESGLPFERVGDLFA
ncbi:restriction endonuclease [Burkholderia gladioli]|nr:restriction endonuclease [Burkholderia gladioli]MBU9197503.1 restriction endonuclease [Burkholderia gladioli]MDN7923066.1 restriction endonuclease [Burkholderia gladioli]